MTHKKRGSKAPYKSDRSKTTRSSVRMQRRRHEIYRDLVRSIPPGLSPKEHERRLREAAEQAGI